MPYAIAYKDQNGKGFSNTEPWIEADFGSDLELCKEKSIEMEAEGCIDVTIFKIDKHFESYSWSYVESNKIIVSLEVWRWII